MSLYFSAALSHLEIAFFAISRDLISSLIFIYQIHITCCPRTQPLNDSNASKTSRGSRGWNYARNSLKKG